MLDASAVIAWLKDEPGAANVQAQLDAGTAIISSINLAEVLTRFEDFGQAARAVWNNLQASGLRAHPYDDAQAVASAELRALTRSIGLSLGDRACLALGVQLGQPVYTADRAWATLNLSVPIILIR
ncbi:type II toxin-antitoxin system VapC family toxin (plasmid) [Deinococcus sp. KNUC1210]|uniref:type II toxin-antitoxin system VapC family toxin n=1 Tax=Deinococcus sp. KNUC1210 TaxID=2917691 RepID=UPI001EF10AEA|nr:type II toxin-antitoxin system VapC family toxin [Deinococcus sp. KNUC1210]ULH17950.1 type II toxin-antitoxin system VapC family toxin [Deinococcus sp. KNUC1210]